MAKGTLFAFVVNRHIGRKHPFLLFQGTEHGFVSSQEKKKKGEISF